MPQPASLSVQCTMTRSDVHAQLSHATEQLFQGNVPMDLFSVPGHQWSPESLVPAASTLALHYQPLEDTDVAAETTVDPILVIENSQSQELRGQWVIPSLPTAAVPAQYNTSAPSRSISPSSLNDRFQSEQLALCKLFDSKHRLQEAVDAATRRPVSKCIGKMKKQGNRLGVYKCQFCDYTSDRSFNTKQHEKTHSDPPIRPHKCIICERGFVRKYDLKIHHQMHIREIREMMANCGFVHV